MAGGGSIMPAAGLKELGPGSDPGWGTMVEGCTTYKPDQGGVSIQWHAAEFYKLAVCQKLPFRLLSSVRLRSILTELSLRGAISLMSPRHGPAQIILQRLNHAVRLLHKWPTWQGLL